MKNITLELAYDGTAYSGLQFQKNAKTIQGVLETALEKILKKSIRVGFAGRTDAGVHALGQVASFFTESKMTPLQFVVALNSLLPKDIRVIRAVQMPLTFHPRYSAVKRWYRYIINNVENQLPFFHNYSVRVSRKLNVELLNRYSSRIKGGHNFSSFATLEKDEYPFKKVFECSFYRKNDFIIFDIIANSFLRKMVRTIVGTFLEMEKINESPQRVDELLSIEQRNLAGNTAPPQGLYLVKIYYGGEFQKRWERS